MAMHASQNLKFRQENGSCHVEDGTDQKMEGTRVFPGIFLREIPSTLSQINSVIWSQPIHA